MKRLLHLYSSWAALGAGLILSGGVSRAAIADYEGSYEALLTSGSGLTALPAGKVELRLTKAGTFSGKLTASDVKVHSLAGKIEELDGVAVIAPAKGSTQRQLTIKRGSGLPDYVLSFRIDDGVLSANLTAAEYEAAADNGVKLKFFAKGEAAAAWAGAYTMALSEPEQTPSSSDTAYPTGSGYAAITVDAKGVLKYTGKLADGTAFTGSLAASDTRSYRLYINPYKTAGSYLGGAFALTGLGDDSGKFHVAAGSEFFWRKAAAPKPNAYKAGFGPLGVSVALEPWIRPAAGATVADSVGSSGKQIPFTLNGSGIALGESYLGQIPAALTLGAANELLPVFGDVFAPANDKDWAKIWKVKVNPSTGVYSGTLTVRDLIITPPSKKDGRDVYVPVKFVNRKLTIEGVLLRDLLNAAEPFSLEGFYQLPPVNAKLEETVAGGAIAQGELEELGTGAPDAGAISAGTAGTYTTTVQLSGSSVDIPGGIPGVKVTGTMKGIPATNTSVTFSIAPDLSYMIFNGRKVPLVGDSRPAALVFSDASAKNFKNTLTLNVYLNTTTGVVTGVGASYIQLLSANYSLAGRTFNSFFPGTATYAQNSTPVKIK